MSKMMMVVKLEKDEVNSVRNMSSFWMGDEEIVENSGGRVTYTKLVDLISNLPYVEPDHQPIVELMVEFFESDEEIMSDRVLDTLNECFG